MSTFSKGKFNASNYAKYRPVYPQSLYDTVIQYRNKHTTDPLKLIVDFGCGTGQATKELVKYGEKVVGVDPSEVMLNQAREEVPAKNVDFKQGNDKTLASLFAPSSVDLLTVAEAAHWFKYPEFWDQVAAMLKPGGLVAIWAYYTFSFVDYPVVGDIIMNYGEAANRCGPYWDPGHPILVEEYKPVVDSIPKDKFTNIYYHTNDNKQSRPEEHFELVKENVPVKAMIALLKTWSPYFNYMNANPDKPDIADLTMEEIHAKTGLNEDDLVTVKWNSITLLATRK